MTAGVINNSNGRRTADVLLKFNRPSSESLFRAHDHLIAVRRGMTLMVPVRASEGRLIPMVDRCPVSWLEASAVLAVDYETATPLSLVALMQETTKIRDQESHLGGFARAVLESFLGSHVESAVALTDKEWRHKFTLAAGAPCRVFIGAAGVRFAFTPDFLEGISL